MADERVPQQFLFTFPMYVIACDYTVYADEALVMDERVTFSAPEFGGFPCLALFTDEHLANEFREVQLSDVKTRAFSFGPENLLRLLERLSAVFEKVVFDPNPKMGRGKVAWLAEFAGLIQRWLDQGRPDDLIDLGSQ